MPEPKDYSNRTRWCPHGWAKLQPENISLCPECSAHSKSYVDAEGEERCSTCDKWLEPGYYDIEAHRVNVAGSGEIRQLP